MTPRTWLRIGVLALAAFPTIACAGPDAAAPRCEAGQRLATVAQSVPGAAYVPCVDTLPAGWSVRSVDLTDDGTSFTLASDREDEPVRVELTDACDVSDAVAVEPRAPGVRTHQLLRSISPDYVGELFDVFPGGCVRYEFSFGRGPHIALMDEMQEAVGLFPRRDLRQELRADYGVDLDP